MNSVIVDYNSGNLHSAQKSFQLISNDLGQGEVLVSSNPEIILKAERIILPGVGSFNDCKLNLLKKAGLIEAMEQRVIKDGVPFLGICVGHQLMASVGLENEINTKGLGWISGTVMKIAPSNPKLKVPHMGWNTLAFDRDHKLFKGINEEDHAYFIHSYHLVLDNVIDRLSYTEYGQKITAAVLKENMVGTQFHPEKSQAVGLRFIQNFLLWRP
ncbi:MAG: imidazole glycerol phosphate synthase subunit HisH [Paracoccaceae bacterium]|nr:imidazole glycerol phosphate synthase subunit HisH [Paracoccaceae bacterium]